MLTSGRALLLVAVFGLTACQTPISVHYEYDTAAPFSDYLKFAWITNEPLIRPAASVSGQEKRRQNINRVVDAVLEKFPSRNATQ